MATLTGSTIASTYAYLLKMSGTAGVVSGLVKVQDGDATDSSLSIGTVSIAIDATDKFYLDGGTHTYIDESAADIMDFYAGGVHMLSLDKTNLEVVVNEGGGNVDFRAEGATEDHLIFADASTNRVGIGQDTPLYILDILTLSGTANFINMDTASNHDTGIYLQCEGQLKWAIFNDATGDASGDDTICIVDTAADDGVKMAQGGAAFADYSDERSKTSLTPIENAVDKLNTLQAVNFKWKYGSEKRRTKNHLGLLAQEVDKVFPEAVLSCDESLYKVIDHPIFEGEKQAQGQWSLERTTLIPVLVKAIQELSAKVTALENA